MDLDYQSRLTSANYIAGRQRLFIGRHTFVKCVFAYILTLGRYRKANDNNGPPADSLLLEDCNLTTAPHTGVIQSVQNILGTPSSQNSTHATLGTPS